MISNKTVWVTGGSSGIGKAVVEALIMYNNFVVVSGRSEERLMEFKKTYPDKVDYVVADVTDAEQMKLASKQLNEKIDNLDLVLLCAGTCEYQDGEYLDVNMYQRVFATNFFGVVNSLNVAIPLLKRANQRSQLVVVGSLSSIVPFPRAEAYGASKAALDYLTKSLQIDLHDTNIDISLIRPGFVDTPLTQKNDFDMPFIISPEAAAIHILKAIAKGKSEYNFPYKLSMPLQFFSVLPLIWQKIIGPKLRKKEAY